MMEIKLSKELNLLDGDYIIWSYIHNGNGHTL